MTTLSIKRPDWRLSLRGTDVTHDLIPMVHTMEYTDNEHGEADEVSVTLDDDGRFRSGAWLPAKADRLALTIGYEGEPAAECGLFEIDRLDLSTPPWRLQLKALSAPVSAALRSKQTKTYQNTTLARIVGDVAARSGLTPRGDIEAIPTPHRTQHDQTDLAFLKRLGEEYGYRVKLTADSLFFVSLAALDSLPPRITLGPPDLAQGIRFQRATAGTYASAVLEYTDPCTSETRRAKVFSPAAYGDSGDELRLTDEAYDLADAALKAKAALYQANRASGFTGSVTVEGGPDLRAGITVAIATEAVFDGRYKVKRVRHAWQAGNAWTADLELEGLRHAA